MKFLTTILVTFVLNLTSSAQIDFDNPPWETGCDSITTQIGMNVCSYEKFKIADSILDSYYNKLIKYVDLQYRKAFNDKSYTYNKAEYLKQIKEQKNAIIRSRDDFKKLLKNTTDIISYQYEGGTIRPMAVNRYALDLTVNQIRVLIDLMEEIID